MQACRRRTVPSMVQSSPLGPKTDERLCLMNATHQHNGTPDQESMNMKKAKHNQNHPPPPSTAVVARHQRNRPRMLRISCCVCIIVTLLTLGVVPEIMWLVLLAAAAAAHAIPSHTTTRPSPSWALIWWHLLRPHFPAFSLCCLGISTLLIYCWRCHPAK